MAYLHVTSLEVAIFIRLQVLRNPRVLAFMSKPINVRHF